MKVLGLVDHRPQKIAAPFKESDGQAVVQELPTSGGIYRYAEIVKNTWRGIKIHRPDLVLVHGGGFSTLLVYLVCLIHSTPLIVRLGGDDWKQNREAIQSACEEKAYLSALFGTLSMCLTDILYSRVAGFLVVSERLKEEVIRNVNCTPERVYVSYPPIDSKQIPDGNNTEESSSELDSTKQVILTVTNLSFQGKYEGVLEILPEIRDVLADHHDVDYVIAGGGQYCDGLDEAVDSVVQDPEVRRRVHIPGYVNDIHELYAAADVFVYPTLDDHYPNTVMEAQAAELPVIANALNGIKEQIDDGENGILIDLSERGMVEEKVRELLSDASKREGLGVSARERVLDENTPKKVSEDMIEGIQQIYSEYSTQ